MKTYTAYNLYHANDAESPYATVWWNGKKLCASDDATLRNLKQHVVDGMDYSSGEDFFKQIPHIYKSGYTYVKKVTVDETGKQV